MAAPTITSVSPSTVWTAGQLVVIRGTNFRLPPDPPASNGPLPDPLPTVAVSVDGVPATRVEVLGDTVISCFAPEHEPTIAPNPTSVTVTVSNLDNAGVPIAGETVSLPQAIAYSRPNLTAVEDGGRVERAFLEMLKRQVLDNVVKLGVSPDFGDAPFAVTELADPPGLVVTGPRCREDLPHWSTNSSITTDSVVGAGLVDQKSSPVTLQLEYTIAGYTKGGRQNTSLMMLVRKVVGRKGYLEVARDPNDVTKGTNRYQIIIPLEGEFRDTSTPNDAGRHSFDGITVVIHGVPIEDVASFPGESLERVGIGKQEQEVLQMVPKK